MKNKQLLDCFTVCLEHAFLFNRFQLKICSLQKEKMVLKTSIVVSNFSFEWLDFMAWDWTLLPRNAVCSARRFWRSCSTLPYPQSPQKQAGTWAFDFGYLKPSKDLFLFLRRRLLKVYSTSTTRMEVELSTEMSLSPRGCEFYPREKKSSMKK